MKTLILLRHAKSSWDGPVLDDHARLLNKRGRKAAPLVGRWLAVHGHMPDMVLCSTALRTRETVALLREAMPGLSEPVLDAALYEATPDVLLERLARLPAGCGSAMLVGHEPGLGLLLHALSDGSEGRRCRRAYEKFPTGAAAVLELDMSDWSGIGDGRARFVEFVTPRELACD